MRLPCGVAVNIARGSVASFGSFPPRHFHRLDHRVHCASVSEISGKSENTSRFVVAAMSFGWSASDVVVALRVVNKVRVALKDAGGAATDYQAETAFLQTVSLTLKLLDGLQYAPLDVDISTCLSQHCNLVKPALEEFLTSTESFEQSLGVAATKAKVFTAGQRLKWAFLTANKAKHLRRRIGSSLLAIQVAVAQQTW